MERNTIHFLSLLLLGLAQFALASYNSNFGPLNMKLSHVNFDVLVNMAAPGCKCSCPLGMGGKQELSGMTILEIKRL